MAICSCGSVFSRSDNLKRHQRNCVSHNNEIPKEFLENIDAENSCKNLENPQKESEVGVEWIDNIHEPTVSNINIIRDNEIVTRDSSDINDISDPNAANEESLKTFINNNLGIKNIGNTSRSPKDNKASNCMNHVNLKRKNKFDVINTLKQHGKGKLDDFNSVSDNERSSEYSEDGSEIESQVDSDSDKSNNESEKSTEYSEDELESDKSESKSSDIYSEYETITKSGKPCTCSDCRYKVNYKKSIIESKHHRRRKQCPYQQYYQNQLNGKPNMTHFYGQNGQRKIVNQLLNRTVTPIIN